MLQNDQVNIKSVHCVESAIKVVFFAYQLHGKTVLREITTWCIAWCQDGAILSVGFSIFSPTDTIPRLFILRDNLLFHLDSNDDDDGVRFLGGKK